MQKVGNSVLAVYKMLIDDVKFLRYGNYTRELSHEYDKINIPVYAYCMDHCGDKYIKFRTARWNKIVQLDILLHKFEPRFYEDEGSDEYYLSINIHEKLVNLEKFQQEFSIFLSSGKRLIDFITETIWPQIDAAVKKGDRLIQKNAEETDRMKNDVAISREDRYKKRCLRMSDCNRNTE